MLLSLKRSAIMMSSIGGLALGGAMACGNSSPAPLPTDASADATATLHFYSDPCGSGDPVSCVFVDPVEVADAAVKTCKELGVGEGDTCPTSGSRCVLRPARQEGADGGGCRSSAEFLTCLAKKRTLDGAGCPQSTLRVKTNVHYFDESEKDALSHEILRLKVASYDYKEESDGPSPSIGFILEDAPNAPFVMRDRSRVNLYSYVSSLVVTVQSQQKQIDEMKNEIQALKASKTKR